MTDETTREGDAPDDDAPLREDEVTRADLLDDRVQEADEGPIGPTGKPSDYPPPAAA